MTGNAGRAGCHPLHHLVRSVPDVPAWLQLQCEKTQITEQRTGAALFGYTELYGRVPAGRRSTSGSPRPTAPTSIAPTARPDERFVNLSDELPTAWQAVKYAAAGPSRSTGCTAEAPAAYATFQAKEDGMVKVVLRPELAAGAGGAARRTSGSRR